MALTNAEWSSIYKAIESRVTPTEIVFDIVIRRDTKHRVVWTETFGDTPIPLVGFEANVPVFDVAPVGRVIDPDLDLATKANAQNFAANVTTPPLGATICIVRQFGKNRTPMCIGQILSVVNYDPPDV